MKLTQQILNGFDKLHLKVYEQKLFRDLDKSLRGLFPSASFVAESLNHLVMSDKKYTFIYNVNYLPFHTRDNDWLAEYIIEMTKFKRNLESKKEISFASAKRYVEGSAKFQALRNAYENNLVREFMIKLLDKDSKNLLLNSEDMNSLRQDTNYDLLFREKVVKAMSALGMGKGIAEEYIERNLDVWYKKVMYKTFYNRLRKDAGHINKEQCQVLAENDIQLWESMATKELQYLHLWLSARENKHYQDHKDVIDRVGTATPIMKITPAQVFKLNNEVRQVRNDYKNTVVLATNRIKALQANITPEKSM